MTGPSPRFSQSVVPSAEGRKNARTRWRPPNLTSHIVREQLIIETPQLLVMWIASVHNLWVKPHLTFNGEARYLLRDNEVG